MQTTLNVPVRVELNGVRLTRTKKVIVTNGRKKETMETKVRLWANATVVDVKDGRESNVNGPYTSVLVRFLPGVSGTVIGYENRDVLARLQPGQKYNFEGMEWYSHGMPYLTCHALVHGNLSVANAEED